MVAKHEFEPLDADTPADSVRDDRRSGPRRPACPAYEISNHARPGAESRHNLAYWRYRDYAGVGPGAHGRRSGMRTVRHQEAGKFPGGRRAQRPWPGRGGAADPRRGGAEALVMGLRLAEGIDPAALAERLGVDRIVDDGAVDRLIGLGLLERGRCHASGRRRPAACCSTSILAEIAA